MKQWITLALCLAPIVGMRSAAGQQPALNTDSLVPGPAYMHMLLEKTIFRVDVLTLELRFDSLIVGRVDALVDGRRFTPSLADSVAAIVLDARHVRARIRFKRGVGLGRFVNAVRDNARRARNAGIISENMFAELSRDLPVWYGFLRERRVRKGDEMFYRIRGDTLRTVYRGVDGEVLLDQTDIGAERRLSVMGGYFAPGSDFRKKLIESLFGH